METTTVMDKQESMGLEESTQVSSTIYLRTTDEIELDICNFWLSFYTKGTLSPQTLLEIPSVEEALDKAVTTGICEEGPLMLTDSSYIPPKFLHLVPMPVNLNDNAWIDKISDTLASLGITVLGLRLSNPKLDISQAKDVLYSVMNQLIEKTSIKSYYFFTKDRGINPLLNVILSLKHSSKKNITILH